MRCFIIAALLSALLSTRVSVADDLFDSVNRHYDSHLEQLFKYFHANPELSLVENKTAARMAQELERAGYAVTTGIGGTGVVAMLQNGNGPLVSMRADMDALPVLEKSGVSYASTATQVSPITGKEVPVMHACGHDVHITSLVGTAHEMARRRDQWAGTLMLIVQPAEERLIGAKAMMEDGLYERFGTPDFGLAFHVAAGIEAGKIVVVDDSPYAGADSVDIIIHGIGTHGASPHAGKDPIVLGAQIVLALQTLVARELPPRHPGVVTVGSFHSGTKHNIIPDQAVLQLTVRNTSPETRKTLLDGIERIAVNMGRVAGLPDDKLPQVVVSQESVPPTVNDARLAQRLRKVWKSKLGADAIATPDAKGMGAEDYPFFTTNPYIPSVYFAVGGTPRADLYAEANGGSAVASHHSPLFKIAPRPAVTTGVKATVTALLELMGN